MPKKGKEEAPGLWAHREGARGAAVTVQERTHGGNLWLRYWSQRDKQYTWENLAHTDREIAVRKAIEVNATLRTNRESLAKGAKPLSWLLRLNEEAETPRKKKGPADDLRHMDIQQVAFGDSCDVRSLTTGKLKAFLSAHRAGTLKVEGRELGKCSDTTAGNDIRLLQTILRWAAEEGHLDDAPVRPSVLAFTAPRNLNKRQPVATYDRFLRVRPHCDRPEYPLFGSFMDLVESLGWRVSPSGSCAAPSWTCGANPRRRSGGY
ncbi:MAG: hypothetical protein JO040_10560 [Gemmatimonadetes bacterium]|nr:hypothetical protein [Gemmatimonadota bacterium]